MLNKKLLKEKAKEEILKLSLPLSIKKERIETITRSIINHLGYQFIVDEKIYLKKDDKIIYIENNPSQEIGCGYGNIAYKTAAKYSQKVISNLEEFIYGKQTLCAS